MWLLGIESRPLEEQSVLLTIEPSLQFREKSLLWMTGKAYLEAGTSERVQDSHDPEPYGEMERRSRGETQMQ